MSGKKVSCEDLKARRGSGIDELIWHTTGSGKTLTSFKAAKLARGLAAVDMVLFVVDRKDMDYQTMREYERFEKGAATSLRVPDAKAFFKERDL